MGEKAMAYHYRDCGLENVWLENGYEVHQTPYGEGVSINNTIGLHKTIGLWLIDLPKPLNGGELRFIRIEMEMTQRHLGSILGATEQTFRLWEKHKKKAIPGPADRLLRALFNEYLNGNGSVRRMVDRLVTLDQIDYAEAHLKQTSNGWEIDHAEARAA
jgi:DNA-binding transcriptional regulator YiaG